MQTFYLIIKKDFISLYEQNGNAFEKIYLNGNPEYYYSVNSAKDHMNQFLKLIVTEYNLDSVAEIDLLVIDNEDELVSKAVISALGETVSKILDVDSVIESVIMRLNRDKTLCISEYGVNFDGVCYYLKQSKIEKKEFSLLAFSLKEDTLMRNAV